MTEEPASGPAAKPSAKLAAGRYGYNALSIGDTIETGSAVITGQAIDTFADLTGDRFEIHMEDAAAQRHGFPGRVAHGLLVLSLIDGLKNKADLQIKARASLGWDWRFRAPVLAGDEIFVSYTVEEKQPAKRADQSVLVLEFDVRNQDDVVVQTGTNRLLAYR